MEEAQKRVYERREVRMFLAYFGKLSKDQCLSVHQNARLVPKRISLHHAVGTVLSAQRDYQHGNSVFLLRQV